MSSRVFSPFRAIGLCSNSVPLSISARGTSVLLATAVGKAFHVYDCSKLHLLFASPNQEDEIVSLIQDRSVTYIAAGRFIKCFKRGKLVWSMEDKEEVLLILLIGKCIVSIISSVLKIWNRKSKELYSEIDFSEAVFKVTSILHPSTYLNKILLGSTQGQLQLWNIRTGNLIYSFNGWGSPVLVLAQSPALDIVGAGLANGDIVIHNLKSDNTLMKFTQDWGPVVSISFRTDGINTVASSCDMCGHIAVWDLDGRRLDSIMEDAHQLAVNGMKFLPDQPVMVTSSKDNSIKMWIFDQSDGSARLLRERRGHSAPPSLIRFIGSLSLLSGGLDSSLRVTALHKDSQSREMSQGALSGKRRKIGKSVKLPALSDLSFELIRRYEWDCIVSCHHGNRSARTWSLSRFAIGDHLLKPQVTGAIPLCCCVSMCGNYTVVGTSTGDIEVFNVQSGRRRQRAVIKGHKGPVRGVAINDLNTEVYSSGADGMIKVWSFYDVTLMSSLSVTWPISKHCYHRNSTLLAVALDSCEIMMYDMDTKKKVRVFKGHYKTITDMCFSSDGRWLLSSSMDGTVRTWDIPSGHLVDCFSLETPPTSISLSDNGEYLACSVVDEFGIFLWTNKTLYSSVSLGPLSDNDTTSAVVSELPSVSASDGRGRDNLEEEDQFVIETPEDVKSLGCGLVTLSNLPKSQWVGLSSLDIVRDRNKPKEPSMKPLRPAPFFIPTVSGLDVTFTTPLNSIPDEEKNQASRIIELSKLSSDGNVFQQQLTQYNLTNKSCELRNLLKTFGPSQIDKEIQLMDSSVHCTSFLKFILENLSQCRDFELTETYLALYLKYHKHSAAIDAREEELLEEISLEHHKMWTFLQHQMDYTLCLLGYCKHFSV